MPLIHEDLAYFSVYVSFLVFVKLFLNVSLECLEYSEARRPEVWISNFKTQTSFVKEVPGKRCDRRKRLKLFEEEVDKEILNDLAV